MSRSPERLAAEVFRLPVEKIRSAYYSDTYFALTKELLEAEGRHPEVTMQVFAKRPGLLGGFDEAIAVLRLCAGRRLADGGWEDAWGRLRGDYSLFAHLETVYLGTLARRSLVMSNVPRGRRRRWAVGALLPRPPRPLAGADR